jgi:hypothetical protein
VFPDITLYGTTAPDPVPSSAAVKMTDAFEQAFAELLALSQSPAPQLATGMGHDVAATTVPVPCAPVEAVDQAVVPVQCAPVEGVSQGVVPVPYVPADEVAPPPIPVTSAPAPTRVTMADLDAVEAAAARPAADVKREERVEDEDQRVEDEDGLEDEERVEDTVAATVTGTVTDTVAFTVVNTVPQPLRINDSGDIDAERIATPPATSDADPVKAFAVEYAPAESSLAVGVSAAPPTIQQSNETRRISRGLRQTQFPQGWFRQRWFRQRRFR